MFARVVEVQVHLAGIGISKFADLEVNHQQALEMTMEEKQIDAESGVVDA